MFRVHHRQFFVVMCDQCWLNRSRSNCTDCYYINRSVARFCTLRLRIAFSAVTNSPYPAKLHKTSLALLRGCIFELAFRMEKIFPKTDRASANDVTLIRCIPEMLLTRSPEALFFFYLKIEKLLKTVTVVTRSILT